MLDEKVRTFFINKKIDIKQTIKLRANTKLNYYIYIIGNNDKSFSINFIHKKNSSVEIHIAILAITKSLTNISINNIIKTKTYGCEVSQFIDGVILDKTAKIIARPTMQIDNKNIIAKHSVNLGYLDKEKIFYLTSKNIKKNDSYALIMQNLFAKINKNTYAKYLNSINQQ
jgi:Fe-S cluster assembly scaffold protein SufB